MVREHPACLVKNVPGQTVVAMRRMLFMRLLEKLGQENTVLFITVQFALSAAPLVVAGTIDVHDLA